MSDIQKFVARQQSDSDVSESVASTLLQIRVALVVAATAIVVVVVVVSRNSAA